MKITLTVAVLLLTAAVFFISNNAGADDRSSVRADSPTIVNKFALAADTTIDWDKMSRTERKQYMKEVVLPKMKKVFHDFDPKRFKDMKCTTCHGNGARTGTFKMPNPQLPKLPATREGFEKLDKKMPKMMEFMSKTVKPTMANLLGMKPFDPKVGSGFGCGNCHTNKKK